MKTYGVLIPAYQPDERLLDAVGQLREAGRDVIVVNDGSTGDCAAVFARMKTAFPAVHVLRHAANRGKGAALRTGFAYFLAHFSDAFAGVVTADADGQHALEDIMRVGEALLVEPEALVMGTRVFSEEQVPLRSRLGNTITIAVFRMVSGKKVGDTQTGLRGIPRALAQEMLSAEEDGFDFELEMLMQAAKEGRALHEVPIRTIYIGNNESSHFHTLADSAAVYRVFWKHLVRGVKGMLGR